MQRLEQQAQTRAAGRPPVREVVVWLMAEDGQERVPYTFWTAPGTEATYPRWEDPYRARGAAQHTEERDAP